MLRKLLACLALLTGLTAAGAPAQAEMAMAMASRMEASASRDQAPRGQVQAAIVQAAPDGEFADSGTVQPLVASDCLLLTVRLRSDRARE